MAQSSEIKLLKRFDQNVEITGTLTVDGTTADFANYLTSIPSEYLTQTEGDNRYLQSFDITTQTDSKYLRSNANDTATGLITLNGGVHILSGTGGGKLRIKRNSGSSDGDDIVDVHLDDGNIYFDMDNDNDGDSSGFLFRYKTGGSFANLLTFNSGAIAWKGNTIIHGGNIGSQSVNYAATAGSVANADTVDNLHASSFLRSDANDSSSGRLSFRYDVSDFNSVGGSIGVTPFNGNFQATNRPGSGNYATGLEFTYYDQGARTQLAAASTGSNNTGELWVRSEHWGSTPTWTNWWKIWHQGNDGSGSGLDADLLDGYHQSSFFRNDRGQFGNSDIGFGATTGFTNTPTSGCYVVDHVGHSSNLAVFNGSGSANTVALQTHYNGSMYVHVNVDGSSWSSKKIWTEANDGSGSGLDADTVDGLQASQFLRSDTSDTMSGTLTINGYAYINPSSTVALLLGRVGGTPTIQANTDDGGHLMMDSNGGVVGLNWYNTNNVVLAQGGGSVGIGSSTVSHKLDVHGNIGLSEYLYHRDDTNTYLRLRADDLQLVAGGRNIIRLDEGTDPDKIQLGDSATYTYTTGRFGVGTSVPVSKFHVVDTDFPQARINDDTGGGKTGIRFRSNNGTNGLHADIYAQRTGNETGYMSFQVPYNGRELRLSNNGSLTLGIPGNGTNTRGRYLSFEGNTDGSGEGSGRLFFSEHNSTTASMDNYGMSIGYRGGGTSVTTAGGNTWTGLSQIGNGQWGMWGHNNSLAGNLIMYGDRAGTFVNFSGNDIREANYVYGNRFVDQGNTSYYVDPASTSVFNNMNIADGIYHHGDTNTYIQFHANDQWRVVTSGAERLEVNNSNTTIQNNLVMVGHIRGNGQQLVLNAGESVSYATGQTGELVYINAEGGLQVNSSPDNWSSGWAGRKTTTINNTAGDSYFANSITVNGHIYGKSVNGTWSNLYRMGGVYFTWDSDSYGTNFNHSITSTYNGNYGDHITLNSYGNVRINIDSNGNGTNTFEIGRHTTGNANTMLTLNESSELTVNGNVRSPIFYDSGNTARYVDPASISVMGGSNNHNHVSLSSSHGRGFRFWNSNSYKIHMSGSTQSTHGGRVAGETTSDYNMYFTMSGGTNRGFVFKNANSSSGANCVAGIDASGNGRFTGDVIAYSSSDKRLKDNITPIDNPIDKVQKISGVTFDWNDKQDTYEHGKHDVGVIAQEIEEVLPEVVDTRENGYKAVKYEKIVPLLIEAIKEQQKQIDELKKLINP